MFQKANELMVMEDRIPFRYLLELQVVNVRDHNGDSVVLVIFFSRAECILTQEDLHSKNSTDCTLLICALFCMYSIPQYKH